MKSAGLQKIAMLTTHTDQKTGKRNLHKVRMNSQYVLKKQRGINDGGRGEISSRQEKSKRKLIKASLKPLYSQKSSLGLKEEETRETKGKRAGGLGKDSADHPQNYL